MNAVGRLTAVAAVSAAVALISACSTAPSTPGSPAATVPAGSATVIASRVGVPEAPASTVPAPEHVLIVVMENKDAEQAIGGDAPFLDQLAASGASFSNAHGVTHPSQPNYLALFSGSTQGVTDDSCLGTFDGPSLGGQLIAAGKSFAGYSEDLPATGFTGCTQGDYARKHNPWVDFRDIPATANLPLTQMPTDYAQLPTVSFVVPNLCNDMHDCDVATGDSWLQQHLSGYRTWAQAHRSLLIVTFDEADSDAQNRIATVIDGAGVRTGTYPERVDHYRLLRTIEDMYHLAPLGRARETTPITSIWTTGS